MHGPIEFFPENCFGTRVVRSYGCRVDLEILLRIFRHLRVRGPALFVQFRVKGEPVKVGFAPGLPTRCMIDQKCWFLYLGMCRVLPNSRPAVEF
jgi:hypothetical protein